MADILSLSRARKDRDRASRRAKADANAARFGRSKTQKARDKAEADRAERTLDAHRRDDAPPPATSPATRIPPKGPRGA